MFQGGDQVAGVGAVGRWRGGHGLVSRPGAGMAGGDVGWPIVLEGSRRPYLKLGDQGAGVAGAEPSGGGQLASADRGAGGAESIWG